MITDAILDFFEHTVVYLLGLIPGRSDAMGQAIDALPGQFTAITDWIVKLGPIVPFDWIETGLQIYVGFVTFGLFALIVRKVINLATGRNA